jgi:hypothetical protein
MTTGDVPKDYDGTEYPEAESSAGLAGIPDGFQRLWTPHRPDAERRTGADRSSR